MDPKQSGSNVKPPHVKSNEGIEITDHDEINARA